MRRLRRRHHRQSDEQPPQEQLVCRFLSDTAEVRTFWDLGYRDPYVVRDEGVPLTWSELKSRVVWRNRLHIVNFRLWTAVLISTGSEDDAPLSRL